MGVTFDICNSIAPWLHGSTVNLIRKSEKDGIKTENMQTKLLARLSQKPTNKLWAHCFSPNAGFTLKIKSGVHPHVLRVAFRCNFAAAPQKTKIRSRVHPHVLRVATRCFLTTAS